MSDATQTQTKNDPVSIHAAVTFDPATLDNGSLMVKLVNHSDGPDYLTMFLNQDQQKELIEGIEIKKGTEFELRGFINKAENRENTFNFHLLNTPKVIVPQKIEAQAFISQDFGIAEIKPKEGQDFEPYKKATFTVGMKNGEESKYYSVEARDDKFNGHKEFAKGQDVLIKGVITTKPYNYEKDGETKKGVNTIIRVTEPILMGTEQINAHIQGKGSKGKSK